MEVKFKNGDSITIPDGCKATVKDNVIIFEPIEPKFKRGDFLTSKDSYVSVIFDEFTNSTDFNSFFNNKNENNSRWNVSCFRHSTPEEKAELIEFMHENGKDWDEEKEELVDWRWRAEVGGEYWVIDGEMETSYSIEVDDQTDENRYNVGNYFKTEELAKEAAKKVSALLLTLKHS